jgi:hypothetical protein
MTTRRLSAMFSVRFTPTELETVQRAAAEMGMTVSSFVRHAAMQAATSEDDAPFGIVLDDIPQYAKDVLYGYREGYNAAMATMARENEGTS